jgi:hypothetical protein
MYTLSEHNERFAKLRKEQEENKKGRKKLTYFLHLQEQKEARQRQWELKNNCPKCRMVLLPSRKCPYDC